MFGANGKEEHRRRNGEARFISFPILFDKQPVEYSVFKRTRNSFEKTHSLVIGITRFVNYDSIPTLPMDSAIQHFPALEAATQTMNTSVQINCDSVLRGRHYIYYIIHEQPMCDVLQHMFLAKKYQDMNNFKS